MDQGMEFTTHISPQVGVNPTSGMSLVARLGQVCERLDHTSDVMRVRLEAVSVRRDSPEMAVPEEGPENALHGYILSLERIARRFEEIHQEIQL